MRSEQSQVVRAEQAGPLASVGRFVQGYVKGRIFIVTLLIGVGIFFGSHGAGETAPVAAERAKQAQHQQEVLSQEYEEGQRRGEAP
jgi:hypothetical protein